MKLLKDIQIIARSCLRLMNTIEATMNTREMCGIILEVFMLIWIILKFFGFFYVCMEQLITSDKTLS